VSEKQDRQKSRKSSVVVGTPRLDCPKIRSPQAADRWTWLVIASHTQLRLARNLAADLRRPWERPCAPDRLTPARVRRGFRNLHAKTSHPASAPKPGKPGPRAAARLEEPAASRMSRRRKEPQNRRNKRYASRSRRVKRQA